MLGYFRSLERISFRRDSRTMKGEEYTHQQFKYFNSFILLRCHLPPHLLWSTTCFTSSSPHTWIIDSRTSNYMTGNKDILSSLDSNSFHPSLTLTDGFISSVQGIGVVNATSVLSLSSVLYTQFYIHKLICFLYPQSVWICMFCTLSL